MLVTSGLVHVQEIPDYRVHDIHASLLHAVAVELFEEDAFFDEALAD
jgi:predicted RNA-binding protein with RPS1 domain